MAAKATQLGFNITVPGKDAFGGNPFKSAPELAVLADRVMKEHAPRFNVVSNFSLDYLWRARGGTRRGEPVYGDCLKPGGLALYYGTSDFVIVFAADHLSEMSFTDESYAALMFECLSHIGSNENTGSAVLLPFDFQGFNASLAAFGPWREDLRKMGHVVIEQPSLFNTVEDIVARADQRSAEGVALIEDYRASLAAEAAENGEAVAEAAAEVPEELPPAEVQPTTDISAEFMGSNGWSLDPLPTNGEHPHSPADEETEQNFAASRRHK